MEKSSLITELSNQIKQALDRFPNATVALSLKDPSNEFYFHLNENRVFHAASLMKVPIMLEIYRQVAAGRLSLSNEIVIRNQFASIVDGSFYKITEDSDDRTYTQLGQKLTIEELVVRMITVSSNIATNILMDIVEISSISKTLESLGAKQSKIFRGVEDIKAFDLGINNTITSRDMAQILQELLKGEDVFRDHTQAMINIMLQQTQNEMIPAGLPSQTQVAHKTGSITSIHHDAGIVYTEGTPPFILVILIEGIQEQITSSQLGADLTRLIYRLIRG